MDNLYGLLLLSAFQGNTTKAGLFKFSMGKTEEFLSATWVVFMTHLLWYYQDPPKTETNAILEDSVTGS
jgi:hypothetical protein